MSSHIGPQRLFGMVSALLLLVACGSTADVTGVDGDGSGASGGNDAACQALFGSDCGRTCSEENACPTGMHCRSGKCHAECGEGFPCSGANLCTAAGRCSDLVDDDSGCQPQTCEEVGFKCGLMVDRCDNVIDCAEEGFSCAENEICIGNPTECVPATVFQDCDVCSNIPDCSGQPLTVLRGRVVSPGRDDDDTVNQVGIPNAVVYILRHNQINDLPAISSGLPSEAQSCDRCEDQDYGPLLVGAVTDTSGYFEIKEFVPVDTEIVLVVQAGKFRRADTLTLPQSAACTTTTLATELPHNPARLPRNMTDGLAVNIPHIAISTGVIDAMECVFYKMGLESEVFGAPHTDSPIHLYHGSNYLDRPAGGAWPNDAQAQSCAACSACGDGGGGTATNCRTTHCGNSTVEGKYQYLQANCAGYLDTRFLENMSRIESYDMVVFDCQGQRYDHDHDISAGNRGQRRAAHGARVREYVNRGGRMFASHFAHTWLYENGDQPYSVETPWETGLADVAVWQPQWTSNPNWGTGQITLPEYWNEGQSDWTLAHVNEDRVQAFASWMENEGITDADSNHTFDIIDPRSMCISPGEHVEVFIDGVTPHHEPSGDTNPPVASRVQQFSFSTPYGAPEDAACGRVAYSGFHVSAGGCCFPFQNQIFPQHCESASLGNSGVLTDQEKVLLYMLFDLGACVGDPPDAPCLPAACPDGACGFMPNGCGGVVDCGACTPKPPR